MTTPEQEADMTALEKWLHRERVAAVKRQLREARTRHRDAKRLRKVYRERMRPESEPAGCAGLTRGQVWGPDWRGYKREARRLKKEIRLLLAVLEELEELEERC